MGGRTIRFSVLLFLAPLWCAHTSGACRADKILSQPMPAQAIIGSSPYRALVRDEARRAGVPADLVDAVMKVESGYDPSRIGGVGEIGLMQVRPATAAMLGFHGTALDLADPATNIHYGATYLGQAWQLTHGDVCRTLMKYRAGHGQEGMSQLSAIYCSRALAHLTTLGSPVAVGVVAPASITPNLPVQREHLPAMTGRRHAMAPLRGEAFWRVEKARVRAITARLHMKWRLADGR